MKKKSFTNDIKNLFFGINSKNEEKLGKPESMRKKHENSQNSTPQRSPNESFTESPLNSPNIMTDDTILNYLYPLDLNIEDFSSLLLEIFSNYKFSEANIKNKEYRDCIKGQEFVELISKHDRFSKKSKEELNLFGDCKF